MLLDSTGGGTMTFGHLVHGRNVLPAKCLFRFTWYVGHGAEEPDPDVNGGEHEQDRQRESA